VKRSIIVCISLLLAITGFSQVTEGWEGKVMTVNGLIPADSMGITLPHEHLLIVHTYDYLNLTNENDAIDELKYFVGAGGKTLAEATALGIGRNPEGLKRISTATGANVIMSAGYYKDQWIPDSLKSKNVEQLTRIIINDIKTGINGIHAGFIKIGMSRLITPFEEKVLLAAAHAQLATGAAIDVHFDGHRATLQDRHHVLDVFENEGVDLSRVYLSHCVPYPELLDGYITLAQRGCYLGFDMNGIEVVVYFEHEQKLPECLKTLIDAGYLDHLLISQDVCFTKCYIKNGGYGYAHILNDIVPQLKSVGITDQQIHTMMVENPKKVFPFKSNTNPGHCVNSAHVATAGIISDNSGVSDYQNNLDCFKLVQPLNCSSVFLNFTEFDIETGKDVLTIYDGLTTSSPVLGQFSGSTLPPALKSAGAGLLIRFNTNGSVTSPGWKANYFGKVNTDYTGPCVNEIFTDESGTITDNSGPDDYSYYMSCQKLIDVPGSTGITLQFTFFETEPGNDYVKVYDGSTTSSLLLGEFSGNSLPPVLHSTGGQMLILFFTNGEIQKAGWSATYSSDGTSPAMCLDETFSGMTGTITDNSGNADYANNMSCQKLIQVPGAVNVSLKFNSFATEAGYDFVKVYDGQTTSSALLGQFSGTSLPPGITSTDSCMLIEFNTDDAIVAAGWMATYSGIPPVLDVAPDSIPVSSASDTVSLQIHSNIEWTSSENAGWLTALKTDSGTLTISIDENTSVIPRSAVIRVSGHDVMPHEITVYQDGALPFMSITPDTSYVNSSQGTAAFTVTSNVEWTAGEIADWLTVLHADSSLLTVNVDENKSIYLRSAVITVSSPNAASKNIIVIQEGASPILSVSPESLSIGSGSGENTFTVASNMDWSVSDNADWLTATKTSELIISVMYDENTNLYSRTAEITISGVDEYAQTISVVQDAAVPSHLKPAPEILPIMVVPNPVTDISRFMYKEGEAVRIEILEPSGRLIVILQDSDTNGETYIDLSELSPGVYLYRLVDKKGNVFNGKILKE
jgi:predicted metal-dependent phosphotriesterase family hydrolase